MSRERQALLHRILAAWTKTLCYHTEWDSQSNALATGMVGTPVERPRACGASQTRNDSRLSRMAAAESDLHQTFSIASLCYAVYHRLTNGYLTHALVHMTPTLLSPEKVPRKPPLT